MLAQHQGAVLNQTQLAPSLGVSGVSVGRYVELLCDLMLLRRLPAWHGNIGKRLVHAPKIYVRDSGIVHALLGLHSLDALLAHPVASASWEGFVLEQILNAAPQAQTTFYRTSHGAEADLVIEFRDGDTWAVEIKRSRAPALARGFLLAVKDVGAKRKLLVAPVESSYTMHEDIEVMDPWTAVTEIAKRSEAG